jgi:hypothetical protein
MARSVGSTRTFAYTADQAVEKVRANGERTIERFSRRTTVRRPDRLTFTDSGRDHDSIAWYDGSRFTLVSNRDKVWVRGPMPPTLDEALDFASAEYAIHIPTADLLYSSPYDALMTADTTGGWVDVQQVGDRSCDHLAYRQAVVDWEIWLNQDERRLPCQIQIAYKNDPGKPVTRVVFHDWDPAPQLSDAMFTARIPEGYQRLTMMRHATVVDETAAASTGSAGTDAAGKEPPR